MYVINLSLKDVNFPLVVEESKPSSTRQLRLIGDRIDELLKKQDKVETLDKNLEYDVTENKKPENNYINSDQ